MDNNCIKIYYENAFEKIARSRIEDYKNALHCCRVSGNVYNQGSVAHSGRARGFGICNSAGSYFST